MNKREVDRIYDKIKRRALNCKKHGKLGKALEYASRAAGWMYWFNTIYADAELDSLITECAENKIPEIKIDNPDDDKVVFIDSFAWDNRGLTQQYLRALFADKCKILFILTSDNLIGRNTLHELEQYEYSEIVRLTPGKDKLIRAREITNAVATFRPSRILLHITPWDVEALMAVSRIKGATLFNINLTDHAFWLGASLIDYNLEFRGYGETLSLQKRGLKQQQILRQPYYPIVTAGTEFAGFPELPEGAIKIICGGSEYKMLGKDGIFFRLMDTILDISPDVVILVAGISAESLFSENVKKMKNGNRVYLIGLRKDINEVFRHSDIYLSSYPSIGGLMTQYAGLNSLPVLAYGEEYESNISEDLINQKGEVCKTRRSLTEFRDYASKLIANREFRLSEGKKCHDAMITIDEFNRLLHNNLSNPNAERWKWEFRQPDYDRITELYLDIENNYQHNSDLLLLASFRLKSFLLFPRRTFSFLKLGYEYLKRRIAGK